ncbi:MAG TPA: heparinase II/III family protein [Verrucomicrobiota bacterium]|nr:heparinase II/III family protein [Verrucomicrobiota bacterium]
MIGIFLLILLAAQVLLVASLVVFVLYWKTTTFIRVRPRVLEKCCRDLLAQDRAGALVEAEEFAWDQERTILRTAMETDNLVVRIGGYPDVRISLGSGEEVLGRFAAGSAPRIAFNAWELHAACLRQHLATGDPRLAGLFWQLVREWSRGPLAMLRDDYTWHDHATASRLLNLRYCLWALARLPETPPADYRRLCRMLLKHLQLLATDRLYDYCTNHGLIVDRCLLVAAASLPPTFGVRRASILRAVARSVGRVDYFISDDGVPLEGSTTYWYMLYDLLSRIQAMVRRLSLPVDPASEVKLEQCLRFLTHTNIQGRINRLGDSSGGHEVPARGVPPAWQEGYHLGVTDAGLVWLNAVKGGRIVAQLILNAQDLPPYVHRHEDALAIGFYHEGVFWFNAPGSYSAEKTDRARRVKSHRNQSGVTHARLGYSHRCAIESVRCDDGGFEIAAAITAGGARVLQRRLDFDLATETLTVTDSAVADGEVVTRFLLCPGVGIRATPEGWLTLERDGHALALQSSRPVEIDAGLISYARNQLLEAPVLRVQSPGHHLAIPLRLGLKRLQRVPGRGSYPYGGRRPPRRSAGQQLAARLHYRRVRQAMWVVAGEVAAGTMWVVGGW